MAGKQPTVITKKQAKKQISHLGRSLVLYIALFSVLQYGVEHIKQFQPEFFENHDPDLIILSMSIVLTLFFTFVPFNLSAKALHLNIRDYLRKPKIHKEHYFVLCCAGIALNLIVTSLSSLFYFFFHTQSGQYQFLGQFNTQANILRNIVYVIFFVLIKPVCDEYIFRGVIQRQLGHYGRYFGVLASAALYAIAQPNLVQALPAFFVGWYLSLITLRYHSILPAVNVHIVLALFLWLVDIFPGNYIWILSILIVIIYVMTGLFIFHGKLDTGMVRYGATEGRLWMILFTTPSMVVCAVLFAVNLWLSFTM
ncbi:MAG: CPBP family intramembrane glutamic endopeptidase [Bulleidia sp.]|nr:CPBP family intramembrane glutamic endopeptidase [Bulleidia sp.]